MAKRSIRKIRGTHPTPSFKERVAAGKASPETTEALWKSKGIVVDGRARAKHNKARKQAKDR